MRIPESLASLADLGIIEEVVRPLMSGKEAQVYLVVAGGEHRVAKIYKDAEHRTFKHRAEYTEGRKTRNTRDQRAIGKRTTHGRAQDEAAWRSTEVDTLYRLHRAGVRVPVPYNFIDGVLVMELVTDAAGQPAPRLAEVPLDGAQATAIYDHLLREVVRMLCAGVVHGDLSEFNVLMAADGPVIIDFPQSVDPAHNPNARKLLVRDVGNLHDFVARLVRPAQRRPFAEEMWELYEANGLTPETPLTGRYRASSRAVGHGVGAGAHRRRQSRRAAAAGVSRHQGRAGGSSGAAARGGRPGAAASRAGRGTSRESRGAGGGGGRVTQRSARTYGGRRECEAGRGATAPRRAAPATHVSSSRVGTSDRHIRIRRRSRARQCVRKRRRRGRTRSRCMAADRRYRMSGRRMGADRSCSQTIVRRTRTIVRRMAAGAQPSLRPSPGHTPPSRSHGPPSHAGGQTRAKERPPHKHTAPSRPNAPHTHGQQNVTRASTGDADTRPMQRPDGAPAGTRARRRHRKGPPPTRGF